MPGTVIKRASTEVSKTLTTSESTSPLMGFSAFSGGVVCLPSGSSITTLTFYVYDHVNATDHALYTSAATPVAVTLTNLAATNAYQLPDAIFGVKHLKAKADAAGTVTFQLKG